jgi:hypothetical protein
VPVAVNVVHPVDGRPVLVAAQGIHRVGGQFTGIGVLPCVRDDVCQRVGCVGQRVVPGLQGAFLYLTYLLPDGDQRIAEAVQFCQTISVPATGKDMVGA